MGVKLLFQYKSTPSFGLFGMPGGSSLSVYSNGKVVKRNYVFGKIALQMNNRLLVFRRWRNGLSVCLFHIRMN